MPDVAVERIDPAPPDKAPKRRWRKLVAGGVFLLFAVLACALLVLEASETFAEPDACTSCHEMQDAHDSWVQSPHYVNRSGVKVTCVSCHLPPRETPSAHLGFKAWVGAKDVCVHFFGEYDAGEARRNVLASLPSQWCIHCHDNLLGAPSSGPVGAVHEVSIKQVPERGYACVACHDDLHGAKPKLTVATRPAYEAADNSYCYVCHEDFDREEFAGTHKAAGVGCVACHGDSDKHASDEEHLTAPDVMYPKDRINASCTTVECHSETLLKEKRGHRPFYAGVESDRKYCTNCHGKHRVPKRTRTWDKATGKMTWTDGESKSSGGGMSGGGMSGDGM